ncbi:putative ATP-dependent RNA helicase dhr2 [Physocladia obscura]|uniref:RNA helicase n=1 Tax=Physocladia obscura TaxID=109957 RepID=A0AAD5TBQ1_9FUNG|nr:putative ATP-dependent RNA helicase dhr2 [Physocladia obscura]
MVNTVYFEASWRLLLNLLPLTTERENIIASVTASRALVIVGCVSCDKLPQFLFAAGFAKDGIIAITQPRRVAASSIAKRVAEEVGVKLGDEVGYSVRFDDKTSSATKIKYMTDGMMLRELLSDKMLKKYSVIILDEAHERTLRTDVLFGMVKAIQKIRKDLKIIVMSATLDAARFAEYFDGAQILFIPGRQYPVRVFNSIERQEDYVDAALVATFQIHVDEPPGDILVFLTGQEEIETVEKLLKEHLFELPPDALELLICPLFASLPAAQQQKVFSPTPPNTRKVILSTNVAETSITLPGIRYIVDTGMAKVRAFNAKQGTESLAVVPISKASALQRLGRAGREAPGVCYRLYTEEGFMSLEETTEPEIMRCNLANVLLTLKAAGVENLMAFDFLDRPPRASLLRALEHLYALRALNSKGILTSEGQKMAEFPVDPALAKCLIHSQSLSSTAEVISIISLLSVEAVFFSPNDKRDIANEAKAKFLSHDGDHLTLLNVMRAYMAVGGDREWCLENFVNGRAIKNALDIRSQLSSFCEQAGINPRASSGNEVEPVLQSFLQGFFMNIASLQMDGSYQTLSGKQICHIHPSSVLFGKKMPLIMFHELVYVNPLKL